MLLPRPIRRITSCFPSFFLILLISELCIGPAPAQAQPQVDLSGKNVLILHTLESSTPLTLATNRGLLDALRIGGANLFFESMDLRRNPDPELRKLLVEQMRVKWSHRKADMVITVYPEALEFVVNDCRDVFPHVPIIALHLPQNFMMAERGRRIISHFPTYDIAGTIDIALKLVPRTKRVYVVSGAHKVDKWLEDQARRDLKKWETRLEFVYLSHMPIEDMLATVSKAPPGSVILALALTQDVAGKSHTGLGIAHQLSQVSTVPVFGMFETALGYGITGGSIISWDLIGKRAGQLVMDILGGVKSLDDVPPVLDVPPVPMFDWRELRRWKLSVSALPKGSIIINRELTFWDFKYYIIGALVFCLVETALIIFLIAQRRRKKAAEEELDQFFNVSLDLKCIANTDGYFLRLNSAWERTLGYTLEELMAKRFLDFIHPDDLGRTREAVSTLASQQKVASFENRYRCKDGTYRWLEWSSALAGNLIYAAARDITERKQAEAEVARARAELLRVERSLRLNEMTASLAHELNQPLAAILSNAQAALRFLKSDKPDLNEFQEIIQDIISDDQRAGNVIRSLRSMMKREEVDRSPIILNNVLHDVLEIFHTESIFRNVHVETELEGSLPPVLGDKVQLQQVVLNLILNAADAMSHNPPEHRKIILRTGVKDNRIRVTVRDFGPGIDKVNLERIFQSFFTTKRTGLGMGLAVCRTIVEAHGGRIWAENNPDRGATFVFELPISGTSE